MLKKISLRNTLVIVGLLIASSAIYIYYHESASNSAIILSTLEKGKASFTRGDYESAYHSFYKAAHKDNVEAQYYLGFLYNRGVGVPQDFNETVKWFQKSGEGGNIEAQFYLAEMYHKGLGIPTNYKAAMKWYQKAHNQSDGDEQQNKYKVSAQHNISVMYALGRGVPVDKQRSFELMLGLAEKGSRSAPESLGYHYAFGSGVTQDYVQSYMWYYIAVRNGVKTSKRHLTDLEEKISPEQVATAKRMSESWMDKHPKQ